MDVEKMRARGFAIANEFFKQHPEHAMSIFMVLECPACRNFLLAMMQEARARREGAIVIDEGD